MKRSLSLLTVFLAVSTVVAADWPQFMGPKRDGHSPEAGLLKQWPANGPPLAWTFKDAGVGYSGPAIVGDHLYMTGGRNGDEWVYALDAAKGAELWKVKIGPIFTFNGNQWGTGPRATPTVAGDHVYALGGGGELVCVDAKKGVEVWRTNMAKNLGGQINNIGGSPVNIGWGYSWAPLVDGDKLIVYPGGPDGAIAALDRMTGKPLWRSKTLKVQASYASPIVAELAGVKTYVVVSNEGVHGVGGDGKELWKYPRKYPDVVIPTPIIHEDHIYVTVGWGGAGCDLIKVAKDGEAISATKVYTNKIMKNKQGGVVLVGKHIYGASDKRGWVCQDFKTGKSVWEEKDLPEGSVIYADGHLYCYTEDDGIVAMVEASPTGFSLKSKFALPAKTKLKAPSGRNWTPPVISNGVLYVRDQELLFAYKIK